MADNPLPHDLDIEKSLLSSILHDPEAVDAVKEILTPADFYPANHKQIITKIFELHGRGEPVDLVIVGSACNGQSAYLAELTDHPIASNVVHYARKVAALAQRRKLWAAGQRIVQLALQGAEADPVATAIAEVEAAGNGAPPRPAKAMEAALLTGNKILEAFKKNLQRSYLIEDVWPDICCLAGIAAPKDHFKSFVVMDMLLSLASGLPYHGKMVRQHRVLYIAAEGAAGTPARIVAWCRKHGLECIPENLTVLPMACCLDDQGHVVGLRRILEAAKDAGNPYGLVVADTVARSMTGDENSTKDMNAIVKTMTEITHAIGPKFGYVHHFGKDATKGPRGSSALIGGTDLVIILKKPPGANRDREIIMECLHVKDAEKFKPMFFDLVKADTGYCTTDGCPVFSLVPELSDRQEPEPDQTPRTGKNESVAISVLERLYATATENLADGGYKHEPRVEYHTWKTETMEAGLIRQRFNDAKNNLVAKGLIRVESPFVFLNGLEANGL